MQERSLFVGIAPQVTSYAPTWPHFLRLGAPVGPAGCRVQRFTSSELAPIRGADSSSKNVSKKRHAE